MTIRSLRAGRRAVAAGVLLVTAVLGAGWASRRPASEAAAAVEHDPAALERARRLVDRIGAGRARVIDVFSGPDSLAGVVVEADGNRFIGWLTPHGDNLIVGALFDAAGHNRSQTELASRGLAPAGFTPDAGRTQRPAVAPPKPVLGGADLQRALAQSAGFVEGDSGPIVSAFIDLNCTFCARLYDLSRAPIGRGRLRIRWIPVAVIGADSLERAAALLQARDRPRALAAAHQHQLALVAAPPPLREAIAANNALLSTLTSGRPATPVLLVQRADGSYAATAGVPDDLTAFAGLSTSTLPAAGPDADPGGS
jgi:thiol:disulfide interchange protein DsbG